MSNTLNSIEKERKEFPQEWITDNQEFQDNNKDK